MNAWNIIGIAVTAWLVWGPVAAQDPQVITLKPDFFVRGAGENVDTIAFWETPDPADTMMFVTAKDNQMVEVWKYPFVNGEKKPLTHPDFTGAPINGVGVDQRSDLLYVTGAGDPPSVYVFELPSLDYAFKFTNSQGGLEGESNFGILHRAGHPTRVYITSDFSLSYHDAATGNELGMWWQPNEVETVFVDPYHHIVYVPDENHKAGVHAYTLEGRPFLKDGRNNFGKGVFQDDAEGIWIYSFRGWGNEDDGSGLILVSDQREPLTDFEIFDRESWEHIATLRLEGVGNTDGIASTQTRLPDYSKGLFTAVHDDQSVAGIGWDKLLAALGYTHR